MRCAMSKTAIKSKRRGDVAPELVLLLLCAFLVRMVLVAVTDGYVYDTNTFSAWAGLLAESDVWIAAPVDRALRAMELQLLALHALCDAIDVQLLGDADAA